MTYTLKLIGGPSHSFEEEDRKRAIQRAHGLAKSYGRDGKLIEGVGGFQKMILQPGNR